MRLFVNSGENSAAPVKRVAAEERSPHRMPSQAAKLIDTALSAAPDEVRGDDAVNLAFLREHPAIARGMLGWLRDNRGGHARIDDLLTQFRTDAVLGLQCTVWPPPCDRAKALRRTVAQLVRAFKAGELEVRP